MDADLGVKFQIEIITRLMQSGGETRQDQVRQRLFIKQFVLCNVLINVSVTISDNHASGHFDVQKKRDFWATFFSIIHYKYTGTQKGVSKRLYKVIYKDDHCLMFQKRC